MSEPMTVEERGVEPESEPGAVDLSIIIVTWNSAPWIERCLRSLPEAIGAVVWESIVIDNASDDDTASRVERIRDDDLIDLEVLEDIRIKHAAWLETQR